MIFRDRQDAARRVAGMLQGRTLRHPLVLAIPRGGVVVGAELARALRADLDVVLSWKLRAPYQPELAVGAVGEDGQVYRNPESDVGPSVSTEYLAEETRRQLAEIETRRQFVRAILPQAPVAGRSVIVTDDGIATGSTMIAALRTTRAKGPYELIVAVPVAPPDRVEEVRTWCDEVVCVHTPPGFYSIGQFYEGFGQVDDAQVAEILRDYVGSRSGGALEVRVRQQPLSNAIIKRS